MTGSRALDRGAAAELTYSVLAPRRPDGAARTLPMRRLMRTDSMRCSSSSATRSGSGRMGDPLHGTHLKPATILSADVKGSTALSRSVELEEWWIVMADLFEVLCEGVSRFGGWVEAFTGDGVVAVFESNGASCDHASRGCEAALWLRDATRRRADSLRRERGLDVSVRIGVNSGEVLTGTIGRRHARQFTASGYAVALAKRVEGLATAGHVCISEHTAQSLGPESQLRDMGTFEVKGAPSGLRVFELVGRT